MTRPVVRDIADLGLSIEVEVPASWGEIEGTGLVLVVGGVLDPGQPTLPPSVAVCLDAGGGPDDVSAAVERQLDELQDPLVLLDEARSVGEDDVRVLEVVHGPEGGARRVTLMKIIRLADTGLVVQAVGVCGAGASDEARAVVRRTVAGCTAVRTGERA